MHERIKYNNDNKMWQSLVAVHWMAAQVYE